MSIGNKLYFVILGLLPTSFLFGAWQESYLGGLWFASVCISVSVLIEISIEEFKAK